MGSAVCGEKREDDNVTLEEFFAPGNQTEEGIEEQVVPEDVGNNAKKLASSIKNMIDPLHSLVKTGKEFESKVVDLKDLASIDILFEEELEKNTV